MHTSFLIDGYNVVFYRSRLTRTCPPHRLRKARESFLNLLARFCERSDLPVTVVFDGVSELPGFIQDRSFEGRVEVIYSPRGQSADESIRSLLDRRAEKQHPSVVTSDRELAASARARSVAVLSAADFLDLAAEVTGGTAPAPGQQPPKADPDVRAKREGISREEAEDWEKLFGLDGDIDLGR